MNPKCRWDIFVEICHIIPVSSFAKGETLGDVNHPDNLLLLCPNCHYLFDKKKLSLQEIRDGHIPNRTDFERL